MTDACPRCGAVPDWHLLYRPEDWPVREASVYWRIVTRHAANAPCRWLNDRIRWAPLAQEAAERQRTGRPVPGSVEDGAQLRAKVRGMFAAKHQPPIERGDAWEGEDAA